MGLVFKMEADFQAWIRTILMMGSPFEVFESSLQISIVKTMQWISPKAADYVADGLAERYPILGCMGVTKLAHRTVRGKLMETKDSLLDCCQDMLEDLHDGDKSPIRAVKDTFRKVGVLLLRTLKNALGSTIRVIMGCVNGVISCCGGAADLLSSLFKRLTKMVKHHLKLLLHKHAPESLVSKLPWDWHDEDEVHPTPKVAIKIQNFIKTARQQMGKPHKEEKAEEASRKKHKNDKSEDDEDEEISQGRSWFKDSDGDGIPDAWDDDDDHDPEDEAEEDEEDFDAEHGGDSDAEDKQDPKWLQLVKGVHNLREQ